MLVTTLLVVAIALVALLIAAQRARTAAADAILVLAATRRDLRPALVLAHDDARRSAAMRAPDRRQPPQ